MIQAMKSRIAVLANLALVLWAGSSLYAQSGAADGSGISAGTIYNITAKSSGLGLDNSGDVSGGFGILQTTVALGNTDQQWQLVRLSNGNYQIICVTSGMALDTQGTTTPGSAIVQNAPTVSSVDQQWQVIDAANGYFEFVSVASGLALDSGGATATGAPLLQATATGAASQLWSLPVITIGANTPFTPFEGESGLLAGGATIVTLASPQTSAASSPQLEASGHAFVHLAAVGQSVTFTNTTGKSITALNLRYSIPDAPTGNGIIATLDLYVNGTLRQAVTLNSKQTWVYESKPGNNGMDKNPADGTPHVFWDEAHAFITGAAVSPDSTITLKMDSSNAASFYNIDLIEMEAPPVPIPQPSGSLSLTADCNGIANDSGIDNTSALQNCINRAQILGVPVWISSGTFYFSSNVALQLNGVTLTGSGPWYTTLYSNPTLPVSSQTVFLNVVGGTVENLEIDENATGRTTSGGNRVGVNVGGRDWTLDNLWIHHTDAGIWATGINGVIKNSRLNNTWADGINVNEDERNPTGSNILVWNNVVRGTGDDGLVIDYGGNIGNLTNISIVQNTMVAPWLADNVGVFGGENLLIANNLITDAVRDNGINIGPFGVGPIQSAKIQGNVVNRGSSYGSSQQKSGILLGTGKLVLNNNLKLSGNTVNDAMFDGVDVQAAEEAVVSNNTVNNPGVNGFTITSNAQGQAVFICNTVTGIATGNQALANNSTGTNFRLAGTCNHGFSTPSTLTYPRVSITLSPSNSVSFSQPLTATVTVNGLGGSTPTGTIILTSSGSQVTGPYSSGTLALNGGVATVSIPGGSFGAGNDLLVASYVPDASSSAYYLSAFGATSVTVGLIPAIPLSLGFSVYHNMAGMYDGSTVTDYPKFLTTDGQGNIWFAMSVNPYVGAINNAGVALSPAASTANTSAGFAGSVCTNCTFQGVTQTYHRPNTATISRPSIDQSGNVWIPVSGAGSTYLDLLVGAAVPRTNPDATGLGSGTFGAQP